MVTFMKIVITSVENGSPDMIPVAFERKLDEKKDEIPAGIYRPHVLDFFQYFGWEDCQKNTKMVITRVRWGPPGVYFGMHLSTISYPQRFF